ncbi:hypothetical protein [Aeromicrobium sp.]|uniref:hypothetical protein n=1 Tax=Aeromicrobium sp. TaxID=1871063 RepID=UPI003D6AFE14
MSKRRSRGATIAGLALLTLTAPLATAAPEPVIDTPAPSSAVGRDETPPRIDEHPSAVVERTTSLATVVRRETERQVVHELDELTGPARLAVSVRDQESGGSFDHGTGRFRTASLVKIHLVALMLWRAEKTGAGLTAMQRRNVEGMLISSENDPATRTYTDLGGRSGIEQGLERAFGRPGIRIGEQFRWGRSTTTPHDVVRLLDDVLDPDAAKFSLMQRAMSRVVPEQRFGISVLADKRTRVRVKVGWFPASTGWIVNSSGRVIVDGSPVLISVMSDRNRSLDEGIARVEEAARLAGVIVRLRRQPAEPPEEPPPSVVPILSLLDG